LRMSDDKELEAALHGTSLGALSKIVHDQGFTPAKNITDNKQGVYCEGRARRLNAIKYSTLNFTRDQTSTDLTLYSALVDIAVNREYPYGRTANSQWVQDPGSILINGVYIHALPVGKLYEEGYLGEWTISNSMCESLRDHPFLRNYLASQGIRFPTPGLPRSSSQPPLKTARGSDGMISSASSSLASSVTANTSADWEYISVRDSAEYQRPAPPPPKEGARTLQSIRPANMEEPPPGARKRANSFSASRCRTAGCDGYPPYGAWWCTKCKAYTPSFQ
jgi:hypothetical protein